MYSFFPSCFFLCALNIFSLQQSSQVSTINKDGKYYRKSLQYVWFSTLTLKRKNENIFFYVSQINFKNCLKFKKKKLRLVNYSCLLRRGLGIQSYRPSHEVLLKSYKICPRTYNVIMNMNKIQGRY